MKKLLIFFMCQAFLFTTAMAQKTISGKVTEENGTPLKDASVVVKGTTVGVVTRVDGTYSINVPAKAKVLVISSVGMASEEISIGDKTIINVILKTEDKTLQEVVVVGYETVRKKDVTAAISKISSDAIENLPNTNFAQAMQGRAAGVIVANSNGIPGGSLSVIVRGVGSVSAGSTPLYVVDGVQLNSAQGSINTQNNPLNFLNPDDIESIEILKDAAAASIYGARAGNGVILVNTKKGKAGKTRFTLNTYTGTSSALEILPVLNTQEWFNVRLEALVNANPTNVASQRNVVLSNLGLAANLSQGKVDSLASYDWQDDAFTKGRIFNVELSMQGGNANMNYYVSSSYTKQSTIVKPTDFQRGALLSKISYKINKKITFDNSISISTFSQMAPYSTGNTGFGNPAYSSGQILPINPIYNADGTYYGLPGSGQTIVGTLNHNVIAVANYVKYFTRTNQLIGSAALTYNVIPELTLKTFIALDYRLTQDHRYQDPRVNDAFAVSGRLSEQEDWNSNYISTTTATFKKTFREVHNVNALAGVEYRHDQNQWIEADAQGFPSYLLQYLSAASTAVAVSGQWTANATFSQFGKLGYSYLSKYIFNYTIRRDGSSRFGTNNLYGTFQSAQFAWNAKQETFLKNISAISDLKLRYSFGQSGNDQIGDSRSRQLYGASRVYGNGSAINPTQLGNPDLTWETREENNIGLDFGLFQNRISLTADIYRRVNKDVLLQRSLYSTTGFTSIFQNLGKIENKGLELLLQVKPFDGELKWVTTFNIAFQTNKVLSLYDTLKSLPSDASIQVGQSLGSQYLAVWAGVNPATGRGMWYDKDGNITYNPTAADRKFIGNIYPSKFGGWTNTITYKGFSLDAFFQYEYGRIRLDGQYQQMMRMGGATTNVIKSGYDARWQNPGDVTYVPRPFNGLADFNSAGWGSGSRYYFKTDYIRLKQITLTYDLQSKLVKKMQLDGVRFYIQGVNIWTYTKWNSYDPEYTGDNFGIIPQTKNVTVGLQVRF